MLNNPPPENVVSDALNVVLVDYARTTNKRSQFLVHVSDALTSSGPRAFCARHAVISYFTTRHRTGGKLTPARQLLFATGNFQHEYIVSAFLKNSQYAPYAYGKWSCAEYHQRRPDGHVPVIDTADNVIGKTCAKCGKPLKSYNEIDLVLPNLLLTGHPDFILLVNGIYYIYEFKTIDRKDVDFDSLVVPLADHRLQVSFYFKIMRALGMKVSRRLSIVYCDRSNSKLWGGYPFKTIVCEPVADKDLEPFKNRLLHVKHGIATKTLPDRICPSITARRAKGCDHAIECFERKSRKLAV